MLSPLIIAVTLGNRWFYFLILEMVELELRHFEYYENPQ